MISVNLEIYELLMFSLSLSSVGKDCRYLPFFQPLRRYKYGQFDKTVYYTKNKILIVVVVNEELIFGFFYNNSSITCSHIDFLDFKARFIF